MAQDITEIVLPGPCVVTINSVNMGHTDEKGVTAKCSIELAQAYAALYGKKLPAKVFNAGQGLEVEFNLVQSDLSDLDEVLPGSAYVLDSGLSKEKVTFGNIAGTALSGVAISFAPSITTNTPYYDLTIPSAARVGEFEMVYRPDGVQMWHCKFIALANEASGTDGSYICSWGDASAAASATAPTVSAVSPLDAATGVDVTANVVWTLTQALDAATVDTNSVLLFKDTGPGTVLTQVAGAVTLVNSGAATTITFNPTASMTASSVHRAILLPRIRNQAGVVMAAAYTSDFTTA